MRVIFDADMMGGDRLINRRSSVERDQAQLFGPYCRTAYSSWICTRPVGHRGDHVAHAGPVVVARWKPCTRERKA